MIAWADSLARPEPPTWLVGASDLCAVVAADGVLVRFCGHPALAPSGCYWADIGAGIGVGGTLDDGDPARLLRRRHGFVVDEVSDLRGWWWHVPQILDQDGRRAFPVAYGRDWLPAPTPAQARALAIAATARDTLATGEPADMQVACQWAAELLSLTYHLNPESIAATGILDDALVIGILKTACRLTGGQVNAD